MILPQRKSIRLKAFDYSSAGYYFITICTKNKHHVFGRIQNSSLVLNEFGRIAEENLRHISDHVLNVRPDKYVIMPNHIHMIMIVLRNENEGSHPPTTISQRAKQSVPKVVQQYKASVSRNFGRIDLWQSGYYDHVVRDELDYLRIWEYIDDNPRKWEMDEYYSQLQQ
jgi:REP element-mobilizing transposase RayT